MHNPSVVKQKAVYEKVCEFKTTGYLYSPREDPSGLLHIISSTGEVFQFNDTTSEQIMSLNGQPSGICFDSNGYVYVADLQAGAIFFKAPSQNETNSIIEHIISKEYDNKPFKGPTSIAFNKEDNVIYFADSGVFENSTLAPFDCCLYSIDLDTRVLRLVLNNLSFVSDVCYDSVNECIYVAETFMNRVIRLKQNEDGVFNASVFYQFSGRVGPSALAIDENGCVFIARYEYSNSEVDIDTEADGLISVVTKNGVYIGELSLPKLPEITGLYISPKKRENLYVTVKNSTGVFKVKISAFTAEIDKVEDALKL